MSSTAEQMRNYTGPALFSYGFRPFFLFGAAWATIAVAIWIPLLSGTLRLPSHLSPIEWHVHELVFGFVPAIVAGFLLTSVPNWTGRLPVVGGPLAALFCVWVCGRIATAFSTIIGSGAAALVDLSFLAALGAVIARELVADKNTSNLKVLAGVALLMAGNLLFHVGATTRMGTGPGERLGIAAAVMLIMIIGGRIIPSFTRNWLAQRKSTTVQIPFGRFDVFSMSVSGVALASWVAIPVASSTAALALIACILNVYRLGRWQGHRATAEALVVILHIAYAFVPIGFGLLAVGILMPHVVAPTGALHGWTAGAIALMTLAVMTRACLGHTGRPLKATRPIVGIYAAAVVAAVARLVAALDLAREPMLHLSAAAWVAAFGGFVVVYAPMLCRPRS